VVLKHYSPLNKQVTVLWLGSLLFIALLNSTQDITLSAIVAGFCMFTVRLLAIYFNAIYIVDGLIT
jgi:ABC-type transport system involved in cytochrome c biogenesis permease subunit